MTTESYQTGMKLHEGEDWDVIPDLCPEGEDGWPAYTRLVRHHSGAEVPAAKLRRVGWLDQKGRVWLKMPPGETFDGGSLTPLLIDARD